MDIKVQQILEKVAAYIAETQPVIDKHSEERSTFLKRAHQVAGVLASRGIISMDKRNQFVDKIAEDGAGGMELWDLVEKLAEAIHADGLGGVPPEKLAAAGENLGPFERLFFYGDSRADVSTPGMLE